MGKNFFEGLNEMQLQAVKETEGACLVIAGAGSGKTKVLTTRIAYLIEKKNVDPYNIIALTFTNKAASEMQERIEGSCKKNLSTCLIGTFHSCFSRILRKEASEIGFTSNFTIFDSSDSKSVVSRIIKDMKLDPNIYSSEKILSKISKCKGELISAGIYKNNEEFVKEDKKKHIDHFCDIFFQYEKKCKEMNAMDFDDLLFNTYILFTQKKKIREKYQERFQYIFIDEFQDTNKLQYEISKIIAAKNNNICVVGDDAQSIYGFRGAKIENILNFKKDFNNCKVIKLEQNYRSTKTIVKAANCIIKNNTKQLSKNVFTENVEGDKIQKIKSLTCTKEAEVVASSVDKLIKSKKVKGSDIAVLYRTNIQSSFLEPEFNKFGIKYKILGGISFYQKKVIKDFLAYLRVIVNPKDDDAIRRSINEPKRGLGSSSGSTLEKFYSKINEMNLGIYEALNNHLDLFKNRTSPQLVNYVNIINNGIKNLQKKNAYEIALDVCEQTAFLKKIKEKKAEKSREHYEDLCELLDIIKIFVENKDQKDKSLFAFLQDLPLKMDREVFDNKDAVSLSTIHCSKGLEFEYVYIIGLQEKIFPLLNKNSPVSDLEEERRLFYVGVTRAKKHLTLSFAESFLHNGLTEPTNKSRFIEEIDEDCFNNDDSLADDLKNKNLQLTTDHAKYSYFNYSIVTKKTKTKKPILENKASDGAITFHPQFGRGRVTQIINKEKHLIKVEFEKYGEKILKHDHTAVFFFA